MPHKERHRWVEEISKINKKINKGGSGSDSGTSSGRGDQVVPSTPGGGFNLDFR